MKHIRGPIDLMNVKNYLSQIKKLNIIIRQKQEECERLKASATGSAIGYDEKVQSSVKPDRMSGVVAKYVDMERELHENIFELKRVRDKIINEIQNMENEKHVELLYKRYVEDKPLGQISREMHYSYNFVRHMHGEALLLFDEKYKVSTK